MSLEKVLNLTATQKPKIVDQKDARRGRLLSRIEGQLALIDAIKGGDEPSKPMRRKSRWFWVEGGDVFVCLQYARSPLELAKGRYSAKCADYESASLAFQTLSDAVTKGHFDDQIQASSIKIRKRFDVKKASSKGK
jgi:hypothetical protein